MSGTEFVSKLVKVIKLGLEIKEGFFWDRHEQNQLGSYRLSCLKQESKLQQYGFSNIASATSLEFPFGFSWHGDLTTWDVFYQCIEVKGFLPTEDIKGSKKIELKIMECLSIYI